MLAEQDLRAVLGHAQQLQSYLFRSHTWRRTARRRRLTRTWRHETDRACRHLSLPHCRATLTIDQITGTAETPAQRLTSPGSSP